MRKVKCPFVITASQLARLVLQQALRLPHFKILNAEIIGSSKCPFVIAASQLARFPAPDGLLSTRSKLFDASSPQRKAQRKNNAIILNW